MQRALEGWSVSACRDQGRCGVYPKVSNSLCVGNPTSICQIMTTNDSDGYEMCRASHLRSSKRSPAKSHRLNGIAGADSRCRSDTVTLW